MDKDVSRAPEVAEQGQQSATGRPLDLSDATDADLAFMAKLVRWAHRSADAAEAAGQTVVSLRVLYDAVERELAGGPVSLLAVRRAADHYWRAMLDVELARRGVTERPAEPGEVCACGRPAVTVFLGGAHGPTGWCGRSDGGEQAGGCPWCGDPDRHRIGGPDGVAERCPAYRVRPLVAVRRASGEEVAR